MFDTDADAKADDRAVGLATTSDRWISAATTLLEREGPGAMTIARVSRNLGESRGAFYWHFQGRAALCDAVLENWASVTTPVVISAVTTPGDLAARFFNLLGAFMPGGDFAMDLEHAVRAWGAMSGPVSERILAEDLARRAALSQMFRQAGMPTVEARHRARLLQLWLQDLGSPDAHLAVTLPCEIEQIYGVTTGERVDPAVVARFINHVLPRQRRGPRGDSADSARA